ncbi:DUF2975 domain-containing protein [Brevundimonas vesicularis]|uniref:DUF2975 domain-containing protein n=1 Tax=Brevundimonas vesicularis TaxID=41276 RepID=UPI0038D43B82
MPRLLKMILDVAYVLMALITGLLLIGFVISIFIPLDNFNLTASDGADGRQIPLSRPLLLFGIGAIFAYFAGFLLILRCLRQIIRSLTLGDPFQPKNVTRLHQIGLTLAVVTGGVWVMQSLVARFIAPGIMDPQGLKDLLTPIFSILIVFVLAEIFREGARLRRESELTI